MYAAHKGKCPINLILVEWGLTLKITCYLVIHADEISMALKSFEANCSMENVHLDFLWPLSRTGVMKVSTSIF